MKIPPFDEWSNATIWIVSGVVVPLLCIGVMEMLGVKVNTNPGTRKGREWRESAESAESAMKKVASGNLDDVTPTEAKNFEKHKGQTVEESIKAFHNVREAYGR